MSSVHTLLVCPTYYEALFVLQGLGKSASELRTEIQSEASYLDAQISSEEAGVSLAVVGIGHDAEVGLLAYLKRHPQVRRVLVLGFAGGLLRSSQTGDLVIPVHVLSRQGSLQTDRLWVAALRQGAKVGVLDTLWSSEALLTSTVDKAAVYAATYAEAVDMEAYVLGHVCQNRGISFAVLKTVLDTAEQELSVHWRAVLDRFGRVLWGNFLRQGFSHPRLIKEALRMRPQRMKEALEGQLTCLKHWLASQEHHEAKSAKGPAVVSK